MEKLLEQELYILSYYRACELAGAILFGRLAMHTDIDSLRAPLTRHCLEEAEHSWLWTKVIKKLGCIPVKVTDAYQTEYGKEFGMPKNILEILCLTQIFEKRTLEHFNKHLAMDGIHSEIKLALQKMIDDEAGHIGWIRKELDIYSAEYGQAEVDEMMTKLEDIDEKVYHQLLSKEPFKTYFKNI